MYNSLITASLLVVSIIHLIPVSGVQGADRIGALYSLRLDDPNLVVLMRHRAALFGIVGGFVGYAAFVPSQQPTAFVVAALSIASFIAIVADVGGVNDAIRRVVMADVVAALALAVAVVLHTMKDGRS